VEVFLLEKLPLEEDAALVRIDAGVCRQLGPGGDSNVSLMESFCMAGEKFSVAFSGIVLHGASPYVPVFCGRLRDQ
jgi:hypothetical protein